MNPCEVFPHSVDVAAAADLRERLRAQRLAQFRALLAEHGRFYPLRPYIRAVSRLYEDAPERAIAFLDSWSTTYFISRILHNGLEPASAANRLVPGLLLESLSDGSSPLAGLELDLQTDVDGSIVVPDKAGCVVIHAFKGKQHTLHWDFEAKRAFVSTTDRNQAALELPLPVAAGASPLVDFVPCLVAKPWDFPIFDRGRELLFHFSVTPDPGWQGEANASLPLNQSLRGALASLQRTWPACVEWAQALIPAFAELEDEYTPGKRQSGSFGPGIPVYLTRVAEEYLHAEDIVHELQHQRFQLLVPADDWFGLWPRRSTLFVSPYRADLRPLAGLHLGVHAFVTVNELRIRYLGTVGWNEDMVKELVSLHHKNVFALRTVLASEEFRTPAARAYYAALAEAMARQQGFLDSRVPDSLLRDGTLVLQRHLDYVQRHSGCEASYSIGTAQELTGYAETLLQDRVHA